ncbi:MAG TPA: Sua5/YciO/YrdC/YwlC family protein, partial [Bacteroidota bacterium]|nr:Sua5/YciO/YrdC/YwlC family protein [Bacteroidota bacterium]
MEDSTSMIIPMAVDGDITRAVRRAARVLTGGGVILYPTDTIYGLGCRATDGE